MTCACASACGLCNCFCWGVFVAVVSHAAQNGLKAAQAFVNGGLPEQDQKRQSLTGPSGGQESTEAILIQLLRSRLLQSNQTLDSANALQLVLLIKEGPRGPEAFVELVECMACQQKEITLTPEQRRPGHQDSRVWSQEDDFIPGSARQVGRTGSVPGSQGSFGDIAGGGRPKAGARGSGRSL